MFRFDTDSNCLRWQETLRREILRGLGTDVRIFRLRNHKCV
jgi:hypothetical protein